MFNNETSLDTFVKNVDNFLAPGGTFIGTTLNKKHVIDLFRQHKSTTVQRFKDGVLIWKIEALYPHHNNYTPLNTYGN